MLINLDCVNAKVLHVRFTICGKLKNFEKVLQSQKLPLAVAFALKTILNLVVIL